MLYQILSDKDFSELMQLHAREVMEYLFQNGYEFSVLVQTAEVKFDPVLPQEIARNFKQVILFVLTGYTYQSCKMDEENLYFEAGFGADNFGSNVTVPLYAIMQILVDDNPIFINLSYPPVKEEKEEDKGLEKSMKVFISNPENEKLLKKKKK